MQLCSLLCPQQHQQRPRVIVQNRSTCLVLPSNPPHGVALDLCCNERGWRGEDLGAMAAKHASLLRLGVGLIARMQSRATQSASPKRLECISPPPGPRPCPCDVPCGERQVKTPMCSRGQELVSLEGRKQGRGGCWPSCASSLSSLQTFDGFFYANASCPRPILTPNIKCRPSTFAQSTTKQPVNPQWRRFGPEIKKSKLRVASSALATGSCSTHSQPPVPSSRSSRTVYKRSQPPRPRGRPSSSAARLRSQGVSLHS